MSMASKQCKIGEMVTIVELYSENLWILNDHGLPTIYVGDFKMGEVGIVVERRTRDSNMMPYVRVITSSGNSGWICENFVQPVR